jgi:hypothetical protein
VICQNDAAYINASRDAHFERVPFRLVRQRASGPYAEQFSQDPTFHPIGSEKVWDRGAALTSRLQTFETEMLTEEENFGGLARINRVTFDCVMKLMINLDWLRQSA